MGKAKEETISSLDSEPRPVRVLPDNVVNQIAAGEVVERPSSVVKELIENSLDAGATDITVVVSNGGKSSIEVIDNGSGMARDDALLAIERFGTSKISSATDLQAIATLGFRGEALPSIASVSKLTLRTRLRAKAEGTEIRIDGGVLKQVESAAMQPGTSVKVERLFFNVPARKKFLRADTTETNVVRSLVQDVAAANPAVHFSFVADGKVVKTFSRADSFQSRAEQLKLAGKKPVVISATHERPLSITVSGLLSAPIEAASSGTRLRLIINGRSVRDRLLLRAVREGYGAFLKGGKYPSGILKIDVPAEEVDVNVHPQKSEVRFRDSQSIFAAVARSVRDALHQIGVEQYNLTTNRPVSSSSDRHTPVPMFSFSRSRDREAPEFRAGDGSLTATSFSVAEPVATTPGGAVSRASDAAPAINIEQLRYLGQVWKLYLLFESPEQFVVVDMHAAHERVVFEKLQRQFAAGSVTQQMMLVPVVIDVPVDRLTACQQALPALESLGFVCEEFGENSVVVRSVPAVLQNVSVEKLFLDLLSMEEWQDWRDKADKYRDAVLARLACHGSVRSGREVEREEAYALLEQLLACEGGAFCPHGRPVLKLFSELEMEALFGRIQ